MKVYLGVDIAKSTFTAELWGEKGNKYLGEFSNDSGGQEKLLLQVSKECERHGYSEIHLVLEPTGGYELSVMLFGYEQGWEVSRPNPKQVRRWAEGVGYRAKTDRIDARMLAEFGFRNQPDPQQLPPPIIREIDYILHRRQDLEKILRGERNRLLNAQARPDVPQFVIDSLQDNVNRLQEEIKQIDKELLRLVKSDPKIRQLWRNLLSAPGIGAKNSLPLLVLFFRFQALTSGKGTSKQLVAFLGLDSQVYVSGTSVRGIPNISKRGDRIGRYYLYMGALGGIRGKNVLRVFYHLLLARGKAKKVALIACARKILLWGWAVFSSNTPFQPEKFPHLVEQQI